MKKLEILCPFCSVENALTVFQAGKDTLFKVKCVACAREFQIDSEGHVLHLKQTTGRDHPKGPMNGMRAQYPSMPDTDSLTPTERQEVQKLIHEIEESEREFEVEKEKEPQQGGGEDVKRQPAPPESRRKGTGPPPDEKPHIVPMKGSKDQVPGVEKKDKTHIVPIKKEDIPPPVKKKEEPISGKEEVGVKKGEPAGREVNIGKASTDREKKAVPSGKDDHSPASETPVARPVDRQMYPYPPYPPGQVPPHYPSVPPYYQYPLGHAPEGYPPGSDQAQYPPGYPQGQYHPGQPPYPYPYPYQVPKLPFLRNPDWAWKLLMISAILGILTAVLLFYGFSVSQNGGYDMNLEGRVYDSDGKPIDGARVHITDLNISRTTDPSGKYSFQDIESGTYTIEITSDDHRTLIYKFSLLPENIQSSTTMKKDFTLRSKTQTETDPIREDESLGDGIYFFPTMMVVGSTISFLGAITVRKRKLWNFSFVAALIGILSLGLFIISPILNIAAAVIILRTRNTFHPGPRAKKKDPFIKK